MSTRFSQGGAAACTVGHGVATMATVGPRGGQGDGRDVQERGRAAWQAGVPHGCGDRGMWLPISGAEMWSGANRSAQLQWGGQGAGGLLFGVDQ